MEGQHVGMIGSPQGPRVTDLFESSSATHTWDQQTLAVPTSYQHNVPSRAFGYSTPIFL